MPKCGICNEGYGELMVKHGEICDDDIKAPSVKYSPEIDDIIKMIEEGEGNE